MHSGVQEGLGGFLGDADGDRDYCRGNSSSSRHISKPPRLQQHQWTLPLLQYGIYISHGSHSQQRWQTPAIVVMAGSQNQLSNVSVIW
ncbi:MAG: hypothetical protein FRX49_03326 [Trebouxia sp. A1-2]|nr:MAG: hypothetical protein FRX49_03326 [Trebouxia sp. A1-2]